MELIEAYPVLFRFIAVSIGLLLVYYLSEYFIKILRLEITRKQFTIIVFGLYLIISFLSSW